MGIDLLTAIRAWFRLDAIRNGDFANFLGEKKLDALPASGLGFSPPFAARRARGDIPPDWELTDR